MKLHSRKFGDFIRKICNFQMLSLTRTEKSANCGKLFAIYVEEVGASTIRYTFGQAAAMSWPQRDKSVESPPMRKSTQKTDMLVVPPVRLEKTCFLTHYWRSQRGLPQRHKQLLVPGSCQPTRALACSVSPYVRIHMAGSYLVDPASSHMLVSKIKPCMSKYIPSNGGTANGSLNQLWFIRSFILSWITVVILELIHACRSPTSGKGAFIRLRPSGASSPWMASLSWW